ncbi:hypothetical protein NFX46_00595 [Streptomyces phaeoluteigriseus]|uniref:Uncharacterized protein n=1 Tax=Streptomyces phaeoluteigriseus TaxID=114686 RepID=A0ABY4ZL65_9ACTN|nr:hypothetical protein [Streptomyces phaeoluteigriseus]USQ89848.1 hypothetical protein NFX46_00595 [Streptomyces phaeoluteigriseus]
MFRSPLGARRSGGLSGVVAGDARESDSGAEDEVRAAVFSAACRAARGGSPAGGARSVLPRYAFAGRLGLLFRSPLGARRSDGLFGVVAEDGRECDSGEEHCVRALRLLERGRRR